MSRKAGAPRAVGVHYPGDLRRVMLDAAVAALDEAGADALSLRDVARRCGVSHAAPAHHFGDKAGLLTVVAVEGFELFTAHLVGVVLQHAAAGPVDQLAALGVAYAEFAERHPGRFDVMFRPSLTDQDDPAYVAASTAAFDALHLHVQACQRAGWRAGEDSRTLAVAAWAFAHGVSVLRAQGALGRHLPDDSLAHLPAVATALLAERTGEPATTPAPVRRRAGRR